MVDIPGPGTDARGQGTSAGPPSAMFLMALQAITKALNAQSTSLAAALSSGLLVPLSQLVLAETSTPTAPASGFILYVDIADHRLKARGSSGTVTTLANP